MSELVKTVPVGLWLVFLQEKISLDFNKRFRATLNQIRIKLDEQVRIVFEEIGIFRSGDDGVPAENMSDWGRFPEVLYGRREEGDVFGDKLLPSTDAALVSGFEAKVEQTKKLPESVENVSLRYTRFGFGPY